MTRSASLTYVDTDLEDLTAEKIKLIHRLEADHPATNGGTYHVASAKALDLEELRTAVRPHLLVRYKFYKASDFAR